MQMHVDALFIHDDQARIVSIKKVPEGELLPGFFLEGQIKGICGAFEMTDPIKSIGS